jgi:hypothetical protein
MRTLLAALIFVAATSTSYAATTTYNNSNITQASFKIKHKLQPKKSVKCNPAKAKCQVPTKKAKKKA